MYLLSLLNNLVQPCRIQIFRKNLTYLKLFNGMYKWWNILLLHCKLTSDKGICRMHKQHIQNGYSETSSWRMNWEKQISDETNSRIQILTPGQIHKQPHECICSNIHWQRIRRLHNHCYTNTHLLSNTPNISFSKENPQGYSTQWKIKQIFSIENV